MTRFFVRTAAARDLPAISALLAETWHATYDGIYGRERVDEITASWHSISALSPRLTRPNSEFIVADDGALLGGMAYAAMDRAKKLISLHQLYVLPSCQGQGIGRMLLEEIEAAFPEGERLRLEVEAENQQAIGFYESAGFEPAGTNTQHSSFSGLTVPALIYEKRLD
ncbi:GNAT family N-acetyltransferase [Consotaella salsifontis]|uniref:Ribosomal protein S18 acetylase RimI n=1 Tax=Consotaella salsifontis TaxID=1365950 RepID=A0A1T4LPZ3_9HYPH|nr:GNAT family N-acetyltransferase [Consotaella salsifontis]SJZ56765.1 Ribosomal protein S18 acetylase RimI [Consotaella salsifontis]